MSDNVIDLGAILPERKPKQIKIKDVLYPARNPSMGSLIETMEAASSVDDDDAEKAVETVRAFMVEIFGEAAEHEIIYALDPSEYQGLIGVLIEAFLDEGKVPGPSRASRRAGARSKPTSGRTTKSTSVKRSSEKNGSAAAISRA